MEETIFGHPKGLIFLFLTEMWERFSFYGMRALLVLYMVKYLFIQPDVGQKVLGFTQLKAMLESAFGPLGVQPMSSQIYGLYTGLVYFTPFFGGLFADKVLGQRKTVVVGGVLMAIGHFMMAFEGMFFPALLFLILGNGCFKPNISTQVGALYKHGDPRRDRAFSIFYVGINVGAFFSPLVCGTLGETVGWHYGFGAAGVGMVIGLIIYLCGQKYLAPDNTMIQAAAVKAGEKKAKQPLTKIERNRIFALMVLCFCTVFFWATYEQQGNTLGLWAKDFTERRIAPSPDAKAIVPPIAPADDGAEKETAGSIIFTSAKQGNDGSYTIKLRDQDFVLKGAALTMYQDFAKQREPLLREYETAKAEAENSLTGKAKTFAIAKAKLPLDDLESKALRDLEPQVGWTADTPGHMLFTKAKELPNNELSIAVDDQEFALKGKVLEAYKALATAHEPIQREFENQRVTLTAQLTGKELADALKEARKPLEENEKAAFAAIQKEAGWTMPTTWYQSFNPFMIFTLTPLVTLFWAYQTKKKKEPSSSVKMAIGCILVGASYIVMVFAAMSMGLGRTSLMWLTGSTFLLTIGELYLSPIGLSLVTKLAPARMVSMMMGMWFLANFAGNYLAGFLGGFWEKWPKELFFTVLASIAIGTGIVIILLLKPIQKAIGGQEAATDL